MKKILTILALALSLSACNNNDSAQITGQFFGYANSPIYVEKLGQQIRATTLDSIMTDQNGAFKITVKTEVEGHSGPVLLNLRTRGSHVPLLVENGERVEVQSVGNQFNNYTVEGSEGSQKIREFVDILVGKLRVQDSLITLYTTENSRQKIDALGQEISRNSLSLKREVIRYVVLNATSLAALIPLYQPLESGEYLFSDPLDHIYYRAVADSLSAHHPNSPYVQSLLADLQKFDAAQAPPQEIPLPEIALLDAEGKTQKLSEMLGQGPLLLDFTQLSSGAALRRNRELTELYQKYAQQGFQVYQVCLDRNRSQWIGTIMDLRVPFVAVHDPAGASAGLYNVPSVPYNFLITKDLDIAAKGLTTTQEIETALRKIL